MDQHDQELLDKQVGRFSPTPRNDGVMMLAILAVFFAGMSLGGFLFAYKSQPIRIASNQAKSTIAFLHYASPITWQ